MNEEIIKNALIGAVVGLLLLFLFKTPKHKKTKPVGEPTMPEMNKFKYEVPLSPFDRWAVRLALAGAALGVFAAWGQGSIQIGFIIGLSIPFVLIGLVVGFVIDALVKPSSSNKRESFAPKKIPDKELFVGKNHSRIPMLTTPAVRDRDPSSMPSPTKPATFKNIVNKIQLNSADGTVTPIAPHQQHLKTWYESEFGIGQKTSDLYLMHYEIRRQTSPEIGYQVLYSHPRKEGQQVPQFISAEVIDKPMISGNFVKSACPKCNIVCTAELGQSIYFGCHGCKFTWWQKQ